MKIFKELCFLHKNGSSQNIFPGPIQQVFGNSTKYLYLRFITSCPLKFAKGRCVFYLVLNKLKQPYLIPGKVYFIHHDL